MNNLAHERYGSRWVGLIVPIGLIGFAVGIALLFYAPDLDDGISFMMEWR